MSLAFRGGTVLNKLFLPTMSRYSEDIDLVSVIGNALNHKDVSTTRKVYAHSAHEAERTTREIAHKKMFEKSEKRRATWSNSVNRRRISNFDSAASERPTANLIDTPIAK